MIGLRSKLRLRLLRYYFANPSAIHYQRELARMLDVDHGNLLRELKRLESEGVFRSRKRGMERYYQLNRNSARSKELKRILARSLNTHHNGH